MAGGVRIRQAGPDDAFALAALTLQDDIETGATPRPGFLDEWAQAWLDARDRRPVWLAEGPDGRPLGLVSVVTTTSLPSLRRPVVQHWHVSLLFVTKDARRAGLGERLMRTMLGAAASAQPTVRDVRLTADPAARSLYERVGFGAAGADLMELRLTGNG